MAGHSEGMTTLVQEREDLMVSSSASPILRLAHFLTLSHNSIHGSAIHPPPEPVYSSDLDTNKESHVNFNFGRWNSPPSEWKDWVDLMYSKHQTLWKKAGILEALLNCKYTIYRDVKLLHDIAARWCSETNTFVFPWGEATLTLEDMMMLGGYSVVGDPVFSPLDTHKLKAIEKKMEHERSELSKTKSKKASHRAWLGKFMNSGNEIEHEAFLVYWLSRFVFPLAADSIVKCVFPIAIHLANGTKIALAPAVLASIYSDLSAYKEDASLSKRSVLVSSPFNLIQIWAWERFPLLQPKPENVKPEEPSFAKWHGLKRNGGGIVTNVTDKVVDSFIWQPYATICGRLSPSRIKEGKQQCLPVTSGTDEEVDAMIKCLRVSELVGIDSKCIEQYLPHRVARQFRLDQDIPALVERAYSDQQLAWENYNRPIENRRFCIPSHIYKPNVTVRYLEWWKKPMLAQDIDCEALEDGMTLRELKKGKLMDSARKKPEDEVCDPAGTTCNALKDCEALEDDMMLRELKKRKLMDSARKKPEDEVCDLADSTTCNVLKEKGSRDKEFLENLESSSIEGSKNNLKHRRVFGDGMSYKRLIKRMALKSVAKKQDVDVDVPPGYLSKCNKASARCSYARNVKKAKESICPLPTQSNTRITSKEVISRTLEEKISDHVKENEVKSIPCLSKDSLFELEARILSVETTLARYKKN